MSNPATTRQARPGEPRANTIRATPYEVRKLASLGQRVCRQTISLAVATTGTDEPLGVDEAAEQISRLREVALDESEQFSERTRSAHALLFQAVQDPQTPKLLEALSERMQTLVGALAAADPDLVGEVVRSLEEIDAELTDELWLIA